MSAQRIHFFSEDTDFRLRDKMKIRKWLLEASKREGYRITGLCYIFCSDTYLLQINRNYLDHDTLTDIITFDNSESPAELAGDIYISIDRIRDNAVKYGVPEIEELLRVMIHGVLHLCSYGDKEKDDKVRMRIKEDMYIGLYKSMFA